jgi:glycosyltransferase involved in cell wall biosynthesis
MNKFNIAIDVSPLNDGNSTRGVGYYTRNLVSALQQEIKNNPDYKNYQIDLVENNKSTTKSYNLIHYPYFDPFKLTLPPQKTPYIVTCHDLIPLAFKKHFPVGVKGTIKWWIQRQRLQKAKYIICPSHSAKYQILDHINYLPDHIFTTYAAATSNFRKITDQKKLKNIRNKYKLPEKYVLYVGDINWNKNIPNLVKACLKLKYPLVIVGSSAVKKVPNHPWTQDILWLQSQKSPLIKLLGFVSDEDIPYIYNLATLYCQPSYSEGFGLPLVEAMQSGTPVCYSQDSCLPEIMDFNGEYFDPYSSSSLESKLIKLWSSPKLRQKYSLLGLIRAQYFSWKTTAIQTLALYRLVELDEEKR